MQGSGEGVAGFYGTPGNANTFAGQRSSILGRLCIARPWASSAVSWLINPSFFDGLCTRYGYGANTTVARAPVDTTALSRQVIKNAEDSRVNVPLKKSKGITCAPPVVREGNAVELAWSCGSSRVVQTGGFKTTAGTTRASLVPKSNAVYGITCEDGFTDVCSVRVIRPRVAVWTEPKEVRLGARAVVYWNTEDVIPDSCIVTGPSFFERGPSGGAATVAINDIGIYKIACVAVDGATTTAQAKIELSL